MSEEIIMIETLEDVFEALDRDMADLFPPPRRITLGQLRLVARPGWGIIYRDDIPDIAEALLSDDDSEDYRRGVLRLAKALGVEPKRR